MGRAWGRVLGGLELGVERRGRSGLGQWASVVLSAHKRLGVPRIKVHFWLMHKRCAASYNPNKMTEKTGHPETLVYAPAKLLDRSPSWQGVAKCV